MVQERFRSTDYNSLEDMVKEFLQRTGAEVKYASFDVAGPVVAGVAKLTNLPWVINYKALKENLNLVSVHLMNDLEATAYSIPYLGASDLATISAGVPVPNGDLGVVAPGTGLGEAFLIWDGFHYRAHASEGGHASFAPTTELELGLLNYLWEKYETVSYERVCSGIGVPNIYKYLRDTGYAAELPQVAEAIAQVKEERECTKVIFEFAFDPTSDCKLCKTTLDIFVSILAVESSNMALKVLATGGIYLGGGIPIYTLPALQDGRFMQAFSRKGRFSKLLSQIPVHVISTSRRINRCSQLWFAN